MAKLALLRSNQVNFRTKEAAELHKDHICVAVHGVYVLAPYLPVRSCRASPFDIPLQKEAS